MRFFKSASASCMIAVTFTMFLPPDASDVWMTEVSIELAEPVRQQFEVFELSQPLQESMKVKRSLMQNTIDAYTAAADYGVAEVTTAATFRLGEVYETFSADLMDSERPTDLDEAALEQYEFLLEGQAFPFEEKAIDLYKANADRTVDGIYDEWVIKSFERLAGLMPGRYAKQETSEGFIGTVEVYAYRMPIAPPETVEGEEGPDMSDASSPEADRQVVVSSNLEASQ